MTSRRRHRSALIADDTAILKRSRRKPSQRQGGRVAYSLVWEDQHDWAPYFDASWWLVEVMDALHAHHVKAISEGQKASGGPQPPLDPDGAQHALAKKGIRPDFRGRNKFDAKSKGTMLHELLTRTEVKGRANAKIGKGRVGSAARCAIKPGLGLHSTFLMQEAGVRARRGRTTATPTEYLFVDGDAEKVIDEATVRWFNKAIEGPPAQMPDFGPRLGRDLG